MRRAAVACSENEVASIPIDVLMVLPSVCVLARSFPQRPGRGHRICRGALAGRHEYPTPFLPRTQPGFRRAFSFRQTRA
jgi:hypothetical protein